MHIARKACRTLKLEQTTHKALSLGKQLILVKQFFTHCICSRCSCCTVRLCINGCFPPWFGRAIPARELALAVQATKVETRALIRNKQTLKFYSYLHGYLVAVSYNCLSEDSPQQLKHAPIVSYPACRRPCYFELRDSHCFA